jgi:hypothetical protein
MESNSGRRGVSDGGQRRNRRRYSERPVVFALFLNLTFATRHPLNGLAQENPSEILRPQCRLSDPRQTIGLFVGPCPIPAVSNTSRDRPLGGYLPLETKVFAVCCPIPQRIFKYAVTVQTVSDETCHELTSGEIDAAQHPPAIASVGSRENSGGLRQIRQPQSGLELYFQVFKIGRCRR